MRLFSRGCDSWHLPYAAAAEGLSVRERLDLEAHAATCQECADALRNAGAVDVALRGAFAPLRERRAMLAPGRVRLAVGPRPKEGRAWLRAPAFFGRLAEVSVMLGVTMFAIGGSFEQPRTVAPEPPSVIQEYFRSRPPSDDVIDYFRWLRLQPVPSGDTRDAVRLPAGGRFDVEPVEIVRPTSTPR